MSRAARTAESDAPSPRWPTAALASASIGVGLLAAGLVVHRSGIGMGAVLRGPPPAAHVLAGLAFLVELVARGARVSLAARGLGVRLGLGTTVRAQLAADAVGAVTPSRIGADAAKLAVLRGGGLAAGPAAALLLAEAASEAILLLACAALVLLFTDAWWVALGPLVYAVVVTSSGVAALWVTWRPRPEPPALWLRLRLRRSRWRALRRAARSFHAHVAVLRRMPRRWFVAVLAAALLHLAARLAVLPTLVLSEAGAPIALSDLLLRPFFVLYATSLLPPPGGGGGVEVAFSTLLRATLSPGALAASLVWWRVYTFYLGALLGCLDMVVRRMLATRGWIHSLHLRLVGFLR